MLAGVMSARVSRRFASLTEEQAAYAAGLLDGDGSIQIHRGPEQPPLFLVDVVVSNTDVRIADLLAEWGMHKSHPVVSPGCSAIWVSRVARSVAADLLIRLTPYLVLKAARARLALDFHQFSTSRHSWHRSADFVADQHRFYAAMQMLNAHGLDRQELALWDSSTYWTRAALPTQAESLRVLLSRPPEWLPVPAVRMRRSTYRRTIALLQVDPVVAAYAAGLFDSEGHVSIRLNGGRGSKPNLILQVSVVNTDPRAAGWLQEAFGGFVGRYRGSGKSARRDRWIWIEQASGAASFLRAIGPWLVAKRERAEIAIAFQEERNTVRRNGPRSGQVLADQLRARARIAAMNARPRDGLQAHWTRTAACERTSVSVLSVAHP
jgi:hypothetical protein